MIASRPFTRDEASAFLAMADATLSSPPRWPWVERHAGKGERVLRFALPLALVPTEDCGRRNAAPWKYARARTSVLATMAGQLVAQATARGLRIGCCADGRAIRPTWWRPLTGRPMVRAIRFSSVAPDAGSGWQKVAIDCLLLPRVHAGKRTAALGVLIDDRPSLLEVREWCEYAPRGAGGALVEVWSGG